MPPTIGAMIDRETLQTGLRDTASQSPHAPLVGGSSGTSLATSVATSLARALPPSFMLVACVGLLCPTAAAAFSTEVHSTITRLALAKDIQPGTVAPPTTEELMLFYQWLGSALATGGEIEGQRRFRARFEKSSQFNARGVRRFLGLSEAEEIKVYGITKIEHTARIDRLALLAAASAYPDLDQRNRRPLLFKVSGEPESLPDGRPIPYDPMALNMGGPEGLASQAHAHYALPGPLTPTSDPEVLRTEPWRFAIAPAWDAPVETFADEMAQLHLDMAILARAWGETEYRAAADYLAAVWLGAGLHYIQDASGPLHNVQVGSYGLFARAKKAWYLRALLTGGGFFTDLPSFVSLGIGLLRNHHVLAERWLATEMARSEAGQAADENVAAAMAEMSQDDATLASILKPLLAPYLTGKDRAQPWTDGRGAGNVLVEQLARVGSRQGGELYDMVAAAASAQASEVGYELPDEGTVTSDLLRDPADPEVAAALARMGAIHADSLRRAATATRQYLAAWRNGNADIAAHRLRHSRLLHMDAAEDRREAWRVAPPDTDGDTVYEPLWFALAFGLILLFTAAVARIVRLVRARPQPLTGPKAAD